MSSEREISALTDDIEYLPQDGKADAVLSVVAKIFLRFNCGNPRALLDRIMANGRDVVLFGLKSRREMNGATGIIVGARQSDRYPVLVIGERLKSIALLL